VRDRGGIADRGGPGVRGGPRSSDSTVLVNIKK
jgi:hypothetical protein